MLNRYLELVDYRPISADEITDIRKRNLHAHMDDPIRELGRYMISEHFAAYFFLRLSRQADEPVLKRIAGFIAQDEFRQSQFAYDLLDARVKEDSQCRERVLQAGLEFRHVGADAITSRCRSRTRTIWARSWR